MSLSTETEPPGQVSDGSPEAGSDILDELGFVPFSKIGAELLFTFCAAQYKRGAMIITTNLEFASWTEVFGDPRLTAALLDRLTHRAHILEFNAESYRFRESLRRREALP